MTTFQDNFPQHYIIAHTTILLANCQHSNIYTSHIGRLLCSKKQHSCMDVC